jgi:uncharacterized DUF497 family protein
MGIIFDPNKNERNIKERGLSFEQAAEFDFDTAIYVLAANHRTTEIRWKAIGYLADKLYALVFTYRGNDLRIISFRRASKREKREYAQTKSQP